MQDQLKIHLIQHDTIWKDVSENLMQIKKLIHQIVEKTDLIILPEMFATGFVNEPEDVAESIHGKSIQWMTEMAILKDCAITGSLVIKEKHQYFNRLVFIDPSGKVQSYNKKHLFSHGGENKNYTSGSEKKIIHFRGWKIAPFICYDLRFPVWSRNNENYDIAMYVANWPKQRIHAWNTLLLARAIENVCFTIGVNRVGIDGNKVAYTGHSQIISPEGNIRTKSNLETTDVVFATLEKSEIETTRTRYKFLNDRDIFTLEN